MRKVLKVRDDTPGDKVVMIDELLDNNLLVLTYRIDYMDERLKEKLWNEIKKEAEKENVNLEELPADSYKEENWISFSLSDNGKGITNIVITSVFMYDYERKDINSSIKVTLPKEEFVDVIGMLSIDLIKSILNNYIDARVQYIYSAQK